MPATQIFVKSPEELATTLDDCFKVDPSQKLILLFEGSTDSTGDSWSESCRKAEALLEPLLDGAPESKTFLMVEVGKENEWNDASNVFKQHTTYRLTALPTMLLMSGPSIAIKRIEGNACLDKEKLVELF